MFVVLPNGGDPTVSEGNAMTGGGHLGSVARQSHTDFAIATERVCGSWVAVTTMTDRRGRPDAPCWRLTPYVVDLIST